MGKPTSHFSEDCIRELIQQVQIYATFPIRSRSDCAILSKKIQDQGAGYISESTLYRLLLLRNEKHAFYANTYDTLAAFIGKKDMNEFEKWHRRQKDFDFGLGIVTVKNKPVKSLIKICIHSQTFSPLQEFTEQLHDLEHHQKMRLGLEIYQSLQSNSKVNIPFFKQFAHLPVIRDCFFENCIDPDFQLNGYEEAIKYYLKKASPLESKEQLEQFVFGNCILFRHYILSAKKIEAKTVGKKLYLDHPFDFETTDNLYIFPRMRYLAYKIWWLELNSLHSEKERYSHAIIEYCENHLPLWSENEQRIAFSCLAETILTTESKPELQVILKSAFEKLLLSFSDNMFQKPLQEILIYTSHDGLNVYKRLYSHA